VRDHDADAINGNARRLEIDSGLREKQPARFDSHIKRGKNNLRLTAR
jgi:hypothetical protein